MLLSLSGVFVQVGGRIRIWKTWSFEYVFNVVKGCCLMRTASYGVWVWDFFLCDVKPFRSSTDQYRRYSSECISPTIKYSIVADPWFLACLTPGSGMGRKLGSGYGMINPDHIYYSLETIFCATKLLKMLIKNVNFLGSDFEFCTFSSLVMLT